MCVWVVLVIFGFGTHSYASYGGSDPSALELLMKHSPHFFKNPPKQFIEYKPTGGMGVRVPVPEERDVLKAPNRDEEVELKIIRENFKGNWIDYLDSIEDSDDLHSRPEAVVKHANREAFAIALNPNVSEQERIRATQALLNWNDYISQRDIDHLYRLLLTPGEYEKAPAVMQRLYERVRFGIEPLEAVKLLTDGPEPVRLSLCNYFGNPSFTSGHSLWNNPTNPTGNANAREILRNLSDKEKKKIILRTQELRRSSEDFGPYCVRGLQMLRAFLGDATVLEEVKAPYDAEELQLLATMGGKENIDLVEKALLESDPDERRYLNIYAIHYDVSGDLGNRLWENDDFVAQMTPIELNQVLFTHGHGNPTVRRTHRLETILLDFAQRGESEAATNILGKLSQNAVDGDVEADKLLQKIAQRSDPRIPSNIANALATAILRHKVYYLDSLSPEWRKIMQDNLGMILDRDNSPYLLEAIEELRKRAKLAKSREANVCYPNDLVPALEDLSNSIGYGSWRKFGFQGRAVFDYSNDNQVQFGEVQPATLGELEIDDEVSKIVLHSEEEDFLTIYAIKSNASRLGNDRWDVPIQAELILTGQTLSTVMDLIAITEYETKLIDEFEMKKSEEDINMSDYLLALPDRDVNHQNLTAEYDPETGWEGNFTLATDQGQVRISLHSHGEKSIGSCPVERRWIEESKELRSTPAPKTNPDSNVPTTTLNSK